MRCLSVRSSAAATLMLLVLIGCGPQVGDDAPASAEFGWSALGDVPWPAEVGRGDGFWSGTEIIIAGGREVSREGTEVAFSGAAYAFSPQTMKWRNIDPPLIDGFDGIALGVGSTVASGWVGLGYPCQSGSIPDENSVDQRCDPVPRQLGYTDTAGWTVSPLPDDVAAGFAAAPWSVPLQVVAADPGQVVVHGPGGLVSLGMDSSLTAESVLRWADVGVGPAVSAACQVGDGVVAVAADRRPGSGPPGGGAIMPVEVSLNTVNLAGGVAARTAVQPLGSMLNSPTVQCLPGRGLLYQPASQQLDSYLQLITPSGSVNWGLPLEAPAERRTPSVLIPGSLVDLGSELVNLGYLGGTVVEAGTGEAVATLAPTPYFEVTVWTGSELLVVSGRTHHFFVLRPDMPGWQEAEQSPFPESFEPGD